MSEKFGKNEISLGTLPNAKNAAEVSVLDKNNFFEKSDFKFGDGTLKIIVQNSTFSVKLDWICSAYRSFVHFFEQEFSVNSPMLVSLLILLSRSFQFQSSGLDLPKSVFYSCK
jgi:hypothetical protein